jgi:hypothetical protein
MISPKKAEWEERFDVWWDSETTMDTFMERCTIDDFLEMKCEIKSFISQTHTDLLTTLKERVEKYFIDHVFYSDAPLVEKVVELEKEKYRNDILTLIDDLLITDEKV